MATKALMSREIVAFNTAAASENRIHDDATARRFGFTGALVPGVEVYAYMCHMPVAEWGRAFLEEGALECRFLKPVYDGARTAIAADAAADGTLAVRVDSGQAQSAEGSAWRKHDKAPPAIGDYAVAQPSSQRAPAGFESLPQGGTLGIAPTRISEAERDAYLDDIREDDPLYRNEGLVHPGQVLRLCNQALLQNVVLGPWIHVGSRVRNFSPARVGDELTLRGKITSNVETKGHAIVTFDAIVIADALRIVARIEHVAIWRPRQVAAAA